MAKLTIKIPNVQGRTDAIDARASNDTYLLESRNISFDASGFRADFGAKIVGGGIIAGAPNTIGQSLNVDDKTYYAVRSGIYTMREDFQQLIMGLDLGDEDLIPHLIDQKWSAVYLSGGTYFCHPRFGLWQLRNGVWRELTPENCPGVPRFPIAIAESNARLLILSDKFIFWSAPSQADRFIPELGGAGFMRLSDRISGMPLTVAGFQMGFVVWTEKDCLLAEFIAGDNVFRYIRVTTEQIPLNSWCVCAMPDGTQVILTPLGLYRMVNGKEPESLTPMFNEFIRKYRETDHDSVWRLDYALAQNKLYLSQRNTRHYYVRTYVLDLATDKWGSFDRPHLGIMPAEKTADPVTYVGLDGRMRRMLKGMTRVESAPGVFVGLDAMAVIGYVRPEELPEADTLFEIQEIVVGNRSRPVEMDFIDEDLNLLSGNEDLNAGTGEEELGDNLGALNHRPYKLSVAYDVDGLYTDQIATAEVALEAPGSILFTLLTSGNFHRFIFEAEEPGEGFDVGYINATAYYYGQVS